MIALASLKTAFSWPLLHARIDRLRLKEWCNIFGARKNDKKGCAKRTKMKEKVK